MKVPKPLKPSKNAHTADTKYGMGDYYGVGIKNPVGRIREIVGMDTITSKDSKKGSKSLA